MDNGGGPAALDLATLIAPLAARFWRRVQKTPHCWLWQGAVTRNGTGILNLNRRQVPARRVAWFLTIGNVPKGARLLSRCGTPACVRPDHLALRPGKGGIRLRPEIIETIRKEAAQGARQHDLARRYGCGIGTINRIIHAAVA